MSGAEYLRSHVAFVWLALLLAALAALVLRVTGSGAQVVVLVCALVVGCCVLGLAADYLRKRRFYRELARLMAELDVPRLAPALLDEPSFAEGRAAWEALEVVARSASDEAAAYRRQVEDYRAYVEAWVHEVKSPLAAARLTLANLREDPADAADPARLHAVEMELHRVEGYVEQALFCARSETVERDYLVRRHRLRDVAAAAVRQEADVLIASRVTPRLGEGLALEAFCDDKWLVFVLGQLLQNSVRYARPDAEGGSQVWLDARLEDEGLADERVVLSVRDNGCGVSAADLPRVFERGFTGENGRTHRRSTGLGLWLVRRLCEKMGLSVTADSREGAGFEVRIAFPTNRMHYLEG